MSQTTFCNPIGADGPYPGDFGGQVDASFKEGTPDTAQATTGGYLDVTSYDTGDRAHAVMIFEDISEIGADQVASAVSLFIKAHDNSGAGTIGLYRLKVSKTPGAITWNGWTSNGGFNSTDIDTTPFATAAVPATANTMMEFTGAGFVALVNGWLDESIPNYGFLMARTVDTAYDNNFVTFFRNDAYPSPPALVVTHATGVSLPTVNISNATCDNLAGVMNFTASLSPAVPIGTDVTFLCNTAGVTATGGGVDFDDLVNVGGTIVAGQTSVLVPVIIRP